MEEVFSLLVLKDFLCKISVEKTIFVLWQIQHGAGVPGSFLLPCQGVISWGPRKTK